MCNFFVGEIRGKESRLVVESCTEGGNLQTYKPVTVILMIFNGKLML